MSAKKYRIAVAGDIKFSGVVAISNQVNDKARVRCLNGVVIEVTGTPLETVLQSPLVVDECRFYDMDEWEFVPGKGMFSKASSEKREAAETKAKAKLDAEAKAKADAEAKVLKEKADADLALLAEAEAEQKRIEDTNKPVK